MADEQHGVLRWEDPPATRKSNGASGYSSRYEPVADELRERPGEWGVVHEGPVPASGKGSANALSTHIRMGALRPFAPAGDFDAVARVKDGVRTVYARYLGDGGCE